MTDHMIVNDRTKEKMNNEQEVAMREWMLSQIDIKHKSLFDKVNKPWDRNEVMLAFFDTIEVKDIVFIPEIYGRRGNVRYVPWYSILSITKIIGNRVDILKADLLKAFDFLTISQLEERIQSPELPGTITPIIVPLHLKDNNYNKRLFVSSQAILTFVRHIAYKNAPVIVNGNDARSIAKELLITMDSLDYTVTNLISEMNDLITEYRIQHLEAEQKRLALYDSQKAHLENALKIAIERVKDVQLRKKYHMYIFTTKAQEVHMKYKFGITDDLPKRLVSLQNGDQTDGGKYVHTVEVYNNKWSERLLHQILRDIDLHCDGEWFMTPGEEASINLLDILALSVNDTYDAAMKFPSLIRAKLKEQLAIDYIHTVNVIMPNIDPVPTDEFILEVANLVGYNKPICKTNLLKKIKELVNSDKYKKYKTKLPTDYETFKTHASTTSNRVNIDVSVNGRITAIKFNIEVANNTNE